MRFLERLVLFLKADAHGVLESIEDRRLLAKQCLRDAKHALEAKRAQIAALKDNQRRLSVESDRLTALIMRLDRDVELALQNDQDELARAAIRRLLPLGEANQRLSARRIALHDEETRLCDRVAVQEQEFEIMKTRLQAELAIGDVAGQCAEGFESPVVTEDDVEFELLRRRQVAAPEGHETRGGGSE